MDSITSFTGPNSFLSNFHPCDVVFEGKIYKSAEHAYVAAKTLDLEVRNYIASLQSPGQAKRAGRTIELREGWDDIKVHVMRSILESKFSDYYLRERLDATRGYLLVEGNTWGDRFWGQCPIGVGRNELGKLLMAIRDDVTRMFE